MKVQLTLCVGWALVLSMAQLMAQSEVPQNDFARFVRENYQKAEHQIPMRDGVKLYTAVYTPKDASAANLYPILMMRTPYSAAPYGPDAYPENRLAPSETMTRQKYIVVIQDVRGRYASEGEWTNMTPNLPGNKKNEIDESSDTYDTIDWLLKNAKFNNGRVGQWGISYPGFYTMAGALDAHPALKASSPQAPIADFFFDDFHHNGAYTLGYFWNTPLFGIQKESPSRDHWFTLFDRPTPDGYDFFLELGPLKNAKKYYGEDNFFWQELSSHPNYDDFWKKRSVVPYLKNIKHAIMIVGGWFDAEDLYGPLTIYKTIEKNNPNTYNTLVMGPFGHGDWARERGHHMHHHIYFGDSISTFYQRNIEAEFFDHFLKGSGDGKTGLPEAYLYDTGKKEWKRYDTWPLPSAEAKNLYLHADGSLRFEAPQAGGAYREFISDPAKPVPYTQDIPGSFQITPRNYMSEDQRFAARRPDVLVFETDVLEEDMTLAGEMPIELFVSTTGTDADWVVKLIDVYPGNEPNTPYTPEHVSLGGYQQLVRSEIMRSRFRESFETPKALEPGKVTPIRFRLQDVLHTFKKGHKMMIQVQSTWFPLFDRNPQTFVPNIFEADEEDFQKATHRVYCAMDYPSSIEVKVE